MTTLPCAVEKVKQLFHFGEHLILASQHLHRSLNSNSAAIKQPEGFIEGDNHLIGETIASQGDDVCALAASGAALRQHEGRDVLHHDTAATDKRVTAD